MSRLVSSCELLIALLARNLYFLSIQRASRQEPRAGQPERASLQPSYFEALWLKFL
jgi:hypothetical protein